VQHFHDFDEDQLDFHAYCVRKQTLRAYLDLLRWEDNVHSHRFYYRAATNLVEVRRQAPATTHSHRTCPSTHARVRTRHDTTRHAPHAAL
jgi:hypothetical protein